MNAGELISDRFELLTIAGQGGMGTVWRARDRTRDADVALKVLGAPDQRDMVARFEREAEVLAALGGAGAVGYVAHGVTEDGQRWLAMEWLDGVDLAAWLARHGAPGWRDAVALVRRIAAALAPAHAMGIVHRDLKPDNIFLADADLARPTLLDFGVARRVEAAGVTVAGVIVGTPAYMAPEQARGEQEVDARADVYALGCLLFELLAGRPPFKGDSALAILMKQLLDAPPRVAQTCRPDAAIPPALDTLVARLLSKDAAARPNDARALIDALDALDEHAPATGPQPALSAAERRIVSVVAASGPALAATISVGHLAGLAAGDDDLVGTLRDVANQFDAHLEQLADGTLVAMLTGEGLPTEEAVRAARMALGMRAKRPDVPLVVTTGRSHSDPSQPSQPVGEVIERAAEALLRARPGQIGLDEVTAGLLPGRFDVRSDGARLTLRAEQDSMAEVRSLLGKPTPCIGRRRELRQIDTVWRFCVEESAACAVLVTGDAGLGKSRLLVEALRAMEAQPEAPLVLFGRGEAFGADGAYALVGSALRRFVGLRAGEPRGQARHKLSARLARHLPDDERARVAAFLAEAVGVPFEAGAHPLLAAAREDRRLLADQVRDAWLTWLAAEARAQPVILALEDLHWGDRPSVELVDAALHGLSDAPLMALALARPALHARFDGLWRERDVTRLELRPLTDRAATKLAREVLGGSASAALVERIVARAEGNAFFLEELLRAAAEGADHALPETVLSMVEARLRAVPTEGRRVLRAASVFGARFSAEAVAALHGDAAEVGRRLAELEARELVGRSAEVAAGDETYRFRNELVREAAYGMLTEEDRRRGHLRAGQWLERRGSTPAPVLALHFKRGGGTERAIEHAARAAEEALKANDFEAATRWAREGVALGAAGKALGRVELARCEAAVFQGDLEEAQDAAERVAASLPESDASWFQAVGYAIYATQLTGREEALGRWIEAARESPTGTVDAAAARVIALLQAAAALLSRGQYHDALAFVLTAEGVAAGMPEAQRPLLQGRLASMRGMMAIHDGDLAAAAEHYGAAVASFSVVGYSRRACAMRVSRGFALLELGAAREAERELLAAMVLSERMGLDHVAAMARQNLGTALMRQGRCEEALTVEQVAAQALEREGDRRMHGAALGYQARILLALDEPAQAETVARQAVAVLEPFAPLRALARAVLSQALAARGATGEALEEARAAVTTVQELGAIDEGEGLVRLAWVEALRAAGDADAAEEARRDAAARLTARAAAISDERRRESYLRAVPEHAALLGADT